MVKKHAVMHTTRKIIKQEHPQKLPTNYGITKKELHEILQKASQPIKKPKSD